MGFSVRNVAEDFLKREIAANITKKMKNCKNWLFALIFAFVGANFAYGQIYEVPLESKIKHSELIIEGRVVEAQSYIPNGAGNIYTSYLVEIKQVIKGEEFPGYIQILEKGGTIGDRSDWVSHRAPLHKGLYALFFCRISGKDGGTYSVGNPLPCELYSGAQGIISLKPAEESIQGRDVFNRYEDVQEEVYDLIDPSKSPKLKRTDNSQGSLQRSQGALGISNFTPQTLTGGTRSVLTIRGTDFGTAKGIISFYNADDGGIPLWIPTDHADILSWEDTLITCWVPSVGPSSDLFRGVAGTGPIKVETAVGDSVVSTDTLTILFSVRNSRSFFDSVANYFFLLDTNGIGGYTFQYSQSFSNNSNAVGVFEKSLKEWRCNSGVNFAIGNPATNNVAIADGTSIVKWNDDPTDSLKAGELAITIARANACVDGNSLESLYYVYEIDMVFKDSTTIFIDSVAPPPSNKFDFYTITLHELGHAHLLNHVVEDSSLMFYGTSGGRSVRMIDSDQLAGADWVMDNSVVGHPYCPTNQAIPKPMVRVPFSNCQIIDGIEEGPASAIPGLRIYPNPISNLEKVFFQLNGEDFYPFISVSISDPLGRTIHSARIPRISNSSNFYCLNSTSLKNGMNIVLVKAGNMIARTIIIKN